MNDFEQFLTNAFAENSYPSEDESFTEAVHEKIVNARKRRKVEFILFITLLVICISTIAGLLFVLPWPDFFSAIFVGTWFKLSHIVYALLFFLFLTIESVKDLE